MGLKTYTISTDVTGGIVDDVKLTNEIKDSGYVTGFIGVDIYEDSLIVNGVSFSDEAACDTLVQDHEAVTLADYKKVRYIEIKAKTGQLILSGFTFDGNQFSLALPAQVSWTNIKGQKLDFTFPMMLSTLDHNEYSLTEANVDAFWTAARNAVKTHLDSGRVLKKSIFDAVDKAGVDAVVDTR